MIKLKIILCTFQDADRKYLALHTRSARQKQKQRFPLPSTVVIFSRLVPHLIICDENSFSAYLRILFTTMVFFSLLFPKLIGAKQNY